ncbi:hypothetical protein J6590_043902 [Homalodisca vitripennis]|nr:hypothetical protein J6590_043902 [Homalodisca vitripennis]
MPYLMRFNYNTERVERPLQGGGGGRADDKIAGSSPFHAHHGRTVSLCRSVCH